MKFKGEIINSLVYRIGRMKLVHSGLLPVLIVMP